MQPQGTFLEHGLESPRPAPKKGAIHLPQKDTASDTTVKWSSAPGLKK